MPIKQVQKYHDKEKLIPKSFEEFNDGVRVLYEKYDKRGNLLFSDKENDNIRIYKYWKGTNSLKKKFSIFSMNNTLYATAFHCDKLGRVTYEYDPIGGTASDGSKTQYFVRHEYNDRGLEIRQETSYNGVSLFSYDDKNRLIERRFLRDNSGTLNIYDEDGGKNEYSYNNREEAIKLFKDKKLASQIDY